MKRLSSLLFACAALAPLATACTTEDDLLAGEIVKDQDGKADTSAAAVFLDVEFDGELVTDAAWNPEGVIEDQLLYTIGQLNGRNAVGRLDKVELTSVKTTAEGTRTKITYHAKLPVAWGSKTSIPSRIDLVFPRDMSYAAIEKFATDFGHSCVDAGAHDVDSGSMWYYYRPFRSGCTMAADRVVKTTAAASLSAINTTGKFPEYAKVWEDKAFNVVAIFGKYEDGAGDSDVGVSGYNQFVNAVKTQLRGYGVTTVPATLPSNPGTANPSVELTATLPDGNKITVTALLTDNVRTALTQSAFRSKYEQLSTRADLIVYNGHAGLGANVRALSRAGKWVAGQYLMMFENGCDTYAYIDGSILTAHAAVNPDDPTGTRYVDSITNGMPAFFSSMPSATMALIRGLLAYDAPKTYEQIFANVDRSQVVLVSGEQDNVFTPGGGGGEPQPWAGLTGSGTIAKSAWQKYSTPTLAAGTYLFEMTGTSDADLYVRIGSEPTTSSYDCRPYKNGSNESCQVTLSAPARLFVNVRGYAASSTFELTGKKI